MLTPAHMRERKCSKETRVAHRPDPPAVVLCPASRGQTMPRHDERATARAAAIVALSAVVCSSPGHAAAASARHHVAGANSNECPAGWESVAEDECKDAVDAIWTATVHTRSLSKKLKITGADHVPRGCSFQVHGNDRGDRQAHHGTNANGANGGETRFPLVCAHEADCAATGRAPPAAGGTARVPPTASARRLQMPSL